MSNAETLGPNIKAANKVHIEAPAKWLAAGWRDFKENLGVSLTYGALFVVTGYILVWQLIQADMVFLVLPLTGCFMLMGPWLALGLYEVCRQRKAGQRPTFTSTWNAWKIRPRRFGIMAFGLLIFALAWVRVAMLLYALMMGNANIDPNNIVSSVLFETDGLVFLAVGSLVGLFFAAIVFLGTAISIPLMLDQDVDVPTAIITSFQVVWTNGHVMWSWAFTIAILIWMSLWAFFVGLIVAMPVIAYASWYAYEDTVKGNAIAD